MRRSILPAVLILLIIALGVGVWQFLFPSPQRAIRRNLTELARCGSVAAVEGPVAQLMNAQKVTTYFTSDVQIMVEVPGMSAHTLEGQDDLLKAATYARQHFPGLQVQFPDVNVAVQPDKTSAVADVAIRGKTPNDSGFLVQELRLQFRKTGRQWLIQRVETVKTLR
jgi:hypothetical protein